MDKTDLSILELLQRDARRSFTDIANELNISEGTVRNRVARLVEKKTVQFVGLIDPNQLGFEAPAMVGVTVQSNLLEDAAMEIAQFPEVSYLVMTSGEYDLIVEVLCRGREHLANFLNHDLRQVEGILQTKTFMILRTFKMAYSADPVPLVKNTETA
jgi:Lrp/AsnC family transcriptional regulator for asnA, asnC and gidA